MNVVTQADRDAAEKFGSAWRMNAAGKFGLANLLARHRIEALTTRIVSSGVEDRDGPAGPVRAYVDGYEYRCDEGGNHTPSKAERVIIEDAIHGFLADSGLVKALASARDAIASLDEDALGIDWQGDPEVATQSWPIRDELLHYIDAALAKARSDTEGIAP